MFLPILAILIQCCVLTIHATPKSVFLYSKVGQLVTSNTLEWQSFMGDPKQMEFAVQAATYYTQAEKYKMYVCRKTIEGVSVTGHTEKQDDRTICIISMHMEVRIHEAFDILYNKGHGAKITWKPWTIFSAVTPTGAVSASTVGHVDDNYCARRKADNEHHHHGGMDYYVGFFAPKQNLGKIIVSVGKEEKEFEDGQILIESEPIRYELRDIKTSKWRRLIVHEPRILGRAQLVNDGEYNNIVETVIPYSYNKTQYWGTCDGCARGLPTDVYENNKAPIQLNKGWGLSETVERYETKTVNTRLLPGTALNVTMKGNYTKIEEPYEAKLYSYYANTEVGADADAVETMSRPIEAVLQTADLLDIKFEFSPVYYIHNNSLVPTTTTTTTTTSTTTTTTTTEAITTTTNKTKSINDRGSFQDSNDIASGDAPASSNTESKKLQTAGVTGSGGNGDPNDGYRADSAKSVILGLCGTILLFSLTSQYV